MTIMVGIALIGGLLAYAITLATQRPVIVAALLGVLPSLALLTLPPFLGLPLLLPWLPAVCVGCLAAGIYRLVRPRT